MAATVACVRPLTLSAESFSAPRRTTLYFIRLDLLRTDGITSAIFLSCCYFVFIMASKKGMTPLLATLMLVVLAVGLGVVVMNFGRAQIEVAAQCAVDIGMNVVSLNGKPQLCIDRAKSQLFFIVENGRQLPIEALKIRIIGANDILNGDVPESSVDRLGTVLKYVPYDFAKFGDIRQVRLTPEITLYDQKIVCTEQSLSFETIRDCDT